MKRSTGIALAFTSVLGAIALSSPAKAQRTPDEAIKLIESLRTTPQGKDQAAPVSFVAPPRTIKDITAILDQQKPDPTKAAALRAAADAQPPDNLPSAERAAFYYQRGGSAGEIGRLIQRRDDLREALRIAREARLPRLSFYLGDAATAENEAGNVKAALAIQEERLRVAGSGSPQPLQILSQMSRAQASLGNLQEADALLAKAEKHEVDPNVMRRLNPLWREYFPAQFLQVRGTILDIRGNYREAETAYRRYLDIMETRIRPNLAIMANDGPNATQGLPPLFNQVRQALARNLVQQGRLTEGESEARRALLEVLVRKGRYSGESAATITTLATIIYAQGRYAEAEQLARAALDIYENVGTDRASFVISENRRLIGVILASQGKWREAATLYAELKKDIEGDPLLMQQFLDGNIDYAVTLVRAGQPADALPIVERAVATSEARVGAKHYNTALARAWLGRTLADSGQKDRAIAAYEQAMPVLLSASRESDSDDDGSAVGQRERQLQLVVEGYLSLLAETRGSAAASETFRLADAIRGQSVQRALAASSARAAASDPALANLARYEQDAQKQSAALQGLLANILSRPSAEQDPGAAQKLRERIDQLRTARAVLREDIEKRFPDYANLIDPRPATVEQAQKNLKPGEALIATYAGEDRLFVWAVPQQGPAAFAASKISDSEVETLVTNLRKALDPNASSIDEVPAFDVKTAYRLYSLMLKPVESGWASAKSLMIVPHKALGQLPTALLVTQEVPQPAKAATPFAEYKGVPFLARKAAVTQLPSVNALGTLRALPPPPANRQTFAAFGDPWFNPEQAAEGKAQRQQVAQTGLQTRGKLVRRSAPKTDGVDSAELALLPRLPDTAEEVKSIALALRADVATDVFLGDAANEKAVKTMNLAGRKIIMFATHGLVPGDLNGLTQPALALSAPKVANVDGDGLLTMEEVLGLKLNADWVVLSACNTASGSGAGAEAVSGLGRAFFYAGTRALLVSNWPVETTSARTLTTDLFRRQADDPALARAEAMRQAMVALIDGPGAGEFAYAHPLFWAPFTVVGDGG